MSGWNAAVDRVARCVRTTRLVAVPLARVCAVLTTVTQALSAALLKSTSGGAPSVVGAMVRRSAFSSSIRLLGRAPYAA